MTFTAIHGIALDFDNTAAHFVGKDGSKGFFRIFEGHGIKASEVASQYEMLKETSGFSLTKLLNALTLDSVALVPRRVLRVQLQQEFEKWLRGSLVPYPDSPAALAVWRAAHIPVWFVTAGDSAYQRHKIHLLHLPCDKVIATPNINGKADALWHILTGNDGPIIFIDDKRSELDAVRRAGLPAGMVVTVHINRPDSPYKGQVPEYPHREIDTLADVVAD